MALAATFALALTLPRNLTVSAAEGEADSYPYNGEVTVKAITDFSNSGVEANGNTYAKYDLSFTASDLILNTAGKLSSASRKEFEIDVPVKDGRVYNGYWDSFIVDNSTGGKTNVGLSVASSGLKAMSNISRYNKNGTLVTGSETAHVGQNFYGVAADKTTLAVYNGPVLNEETGWYTSSYSNIHIHATDKTKNSNIGMIFLSSTYYNGLAKFVAATHTYCGAGKASGTGWANGKNYTWKLTADEICDHMPAISGKMADGTTDYTGTVYTKEELVAVEWNFTKNCTGLACTDAECPNNNEKRMEKALAAAPMYYGIDNLIWTVNAEFSETEVEVTGGSATVDVVTNPTANATVKYLDVAGKKVVVNDYFDAKYTITPTNGTLKSVIYAGEALAVTDNEDGSYSVSAPAESAAQGNVLSIVLEGDEEDSFVTLDSYASEQPDSGKVEIDGTVYKSPFSVVLYGRIAGNPSEYGFKLQQLSDETAGILGGTVKLIPEEIAEDGSFAIRAIGEGMVAGNYNAWPYYISGDAEVDDSDYQKSIILKAASAQE